MPTAYMMTWSIFMIVALSIGRLRSWRHILAVVLVNAFVLLLSQSLYIQLSISAGLDPSSILYAAGEFLKGGLFGWMALLVMPCGWLGPMIGLNLLHRWSRATQEAF